MSLSIAGKSAIVSSHPLNVGGIGETGPGCREARTFPEG